MTVDADLSEWDYGDYEGKRAGEIRAAQPGWNLWRDGCPGGESPAQVSDRADRLIARLQANHPSLNQIDANEKTPCLRVFPIRQDVYLVPCAPPHEKLDRSAML